MLIIGYSYDELELETFLGYIRGFTFTHIYHKNWVVALKPNENKEKPV